MSAYKCIFCIGEAYRSTSRKLSWVYWIFKSRKFRPFFHYGTFSSRYYGSSQKETVAAEELYVRGGKGKRETGKGEM
jgi:hypothetical protein